MSKFSKLGLRRAAGATALAAVAALGLGSTIGTGAADAKPLRDGFKSVSGIDGEKASLWRQHESQFSVKRVAYNGLGRTALLSGVYTTKLSKGVSGNLQTYVIAGCQVDVGEIGASSAASLLVSATPSVSLTGGLSAPLKPGEVTAYEVTDKDIAEGKAGAIQLSNYEIEFPNCGGYASARSVVKIIAAKGFAISDDDDAVTGEGTILQSTLYGQPFFVS
ncbi:hypothetical protein GII33_17810 [Gordonia pseudamarae]|mgnify:FL=1|uniref:MspA family porin n=1 Tax=Gordonia TaxID=2053 RepID=UPI0019CE0E26|nr:MULTISPECIES: MspA family porin [Gordonia]MBD0021173.1 MspA family porin [Gordonia sp. (in: high G+C Gram-positive bacteria)]QHN27543.1 hypothetical protein GII33_17810 [Gordonia pseudamarae]